MSANQTPPQTNLHHLADRLGIYRHFVGASGDLRTVADESLRALCGTLGFPADCDSAIDQSLTLLGAARPRLQAVLVASVGNTLHAIWEGGIPDDAVLTWQIALEHGGLVEGRAALTAASTSPADGHGGAVFALPLADIAMGYHHLTVRCGAELESCTLIVAPSRAWTPPQWASQGRRDWSITVQLYSLRSSGNWGIGDFSDLGRLAHLAAGVGASSIGLNPLHALFPANPRHLSPYSPSSRAFLNPVYIDVEAVPEFAFDTASRALCAAPAFAARLQAARAAQSVDHVLVWDLKLQVLHRLFARFQDDLAHQRNIERVAAFEAFKTTSGLALHRFAVFEALQQHLLDHKESFSWHAWPADYRDVESAAVADFAAAHHEAVEFSKFMQWEADRQLKAVAQTMTELGMATGLYRDVAVGVDPNGADAWADPGLLVAGATVGAPPDDYNPLGQDWGLTPFNPVALKQRAYAPFIAAVRANMQHAGAVRIDHVIGLKRLYWVPNGANAAAGAYVAYPFEDLMAIVALESQRQQCLVVGEDLGTVPEGFRDEAALRGLLSYRVLLFERAGGDGPFLPPQHYPALAAAALSTHDLPTLTGLWLGRDLEWRRQLGLYPDQDAARGDIEFRRNTRKALLASLVDQGDLTPHTATRLAEIDRPPPELMAELITAAHRFLARAPSHLLLVQIEDLAGEIEQMNLPGTVDQHPNWRRKLQLELDALFADPALVNTSNAIMDGRGAASTS